MRMLQARQIDVIDHLCPDHLASAHTVPLLVMDIYHLIVECPDFQPLRDKNHSHFKPSNAILLCLKESHACLHTSSFLTV